MSWIKVKILLLMIFNISQFAMAQIDPAYTISNYPNPQISPASCAQISGSYVCNANNIISQLDVDSIGQIITDTYDITKGQACEDIADSPDEGYRVALAIVPRIDNTAGFNNQQHRLISDNFAEGLRLTWKYGSCENDVVVVYVPASNMIGISSGRSALKRLPLDYSTNAIDDTLTRINRNNAGQELKALLEKFKESLTLWSWQRVFTFLWAFILAVVAVALVIIIIVVCVKCKKRPEVEKANEKAEATDAEEAGCCFCCPCGKKEDEESRIDKLFKDPETENDAKNTKSPAVIPQWAKEKKEDEVKKVKEKSQEKSNKKSVRKEKTVVVVGSNTKKEKAQVQKKQRKSKKKDDISSVVAEEADIYHKGEKRKRTKLIIEVGGPDDEVGEKKVQKKQKQEQMNNIGAPSKVIFRPSTKTNSLIRVCPAPENAPLMNPVTDVQPILIPINPYVLNQALMNPAPAPNSSVYGPVIRTVQQQPFAPVYTPVPYKPPQVEPWMVDNTANYSGPTPGDQSSVVNVNDNVASCRVVIGLDDDRDVATVRPNSVNLIEYADDNTVPVAIFPVNDHPVPKVANNLSGGLTVVSVNDDDNFQPEKHVVNKVKSDSKVAAGKDKKNDQKKKKKKQSSGESSESSSSEESDSESDTSESRSGSDSGSSKKSDKSKESSEKSSSSESSSESEAEIRRKAEEQKKMYAKQKKALEKAKGKSSHRKSRSPPPSPPRERKSTKSKEKSNKPKSSKNSRRASDDSQKLGMATKWSSKGGFSKKGELDYF